MVLLLFYNCKEEPTQPLVQAKTTVNKKNTSSQNDSTQISKVVKVDSLKTKDKGIIVPDAVICGTLDLTLWEFDHYQANPGKRVGILPSDNIFYYQSARIKWFKDTLGYNYINCRSEFIPTARQQTYTDSKIMVGGFVLTNMTQATNTVVAYPAMYAYYFDEPVGGDAGYTVECENVTSLLAQFSQTLNNNGSSSSKIIVGDTTPPYADCSSYADILMCTRYYEDVLHLYPDQRPLWSAFRTNFSTKFSDTWISASTDLAEYDQLLGHAANLGLNGVWLYNWEGANDQIGQFSFYAWKWGFLTRVERQYIYTYECDKPNPCDCDRNNITDGWVLVNKLATPGYRNRAW